MPFTTRANPYSPNLSQNRFGVATIVNEKHKKVWNVTKSVVTLQCQKSTKRLATDKESEFKMIILTIKLKKGKELWQQHQ